MGHGQTVQYCALRFLPQFGFSDVPDEDTDALRKWICTDLYPLPLLLTMTFKLYRYPLRSAPAQLLFRRLADCVRHEFPVISSDDFLPGLADKLRARIIGIDQAPVVVHDQKALRNAGQDLAGMVIGLAQPGQQECQRSGKSNPESCELQISVAEGPVVRRRQKIIVSKRCSPKDREYALPETTEPGADEHGSAEDNEGSQRQNRPGNDGQQTRETGCGQSDNIGRRAGKKTGAQRKES